MAELSLAQALEHLVKGIVGQPEKVRVVTMQGARADTLQIHVDPTDLGRVIGRSGRTAQALRTVISALAAGERVRVDVIDTDEVEAS